MAEQTLDDKIRQIISYHTGCRISEITDDARLEDLGADSLDTVELVLALEEEFKIEVPDEDIERCETVKDIIFYVKAKMGV